MDIPTAIKKLKKIVEEMSRLDIELEASGYDDASDFVGDARAVVCDTIDKIEEVE